MDGDLRMTKASRKLTKNDRHALISNDDKGNKTEETEYTATGDMRERVVYEYNARCL